MKRSEIIAEIILWLEQTDYLNLPTAQGSDFSRAADELLTKLEKAGMQPPENYRVHDNGMFIIEGWEE
jgi:hypothetical protein